MCKTPMARALCATSCETERPTGDRWRPLASAMGRCHKQRKRGATFASPLALQVARDQIKSTLHPCLQECYPLPLFHHSHPASVRQHLLKALEALASFRRIGTQHRLGMARSCVVVGWVQLERTVEVDQRQTVFFPHVMHDTPATIAPGRSGLQLDRAIAINKRVLHISKFGIT